MAQRVSNLRRKIRASISEGMQTSLPSGEVTDVVRMPDDSSLRSWLASLRREFTDWHVLNSLTSKKRMFIKAVLIGMKICCLIRTVLLISANHVPAGILFFCGDQMRNLEVTMRSMVIFVCLSFGSIILVFELLILVAEVKKEESFITDAFQWATTIKKLDFSLSEVKELHYWMRMTRTISHILFYLASFTMPSMIAYSGFMEVAKSKSLVRIFLILLWAPMSIFWIIRESKIYLILMSVIVLDLKLIQVRIKSLNRRFTVDKTICVNKYLQEFFIVRDYITAHNKYVRWILMMIDYVSAPGNCANLYSAIASNGVLLLKMMNISYSIFLMIATFLMIALPGRISSGILHVHPKLMSMQVREKNLSISDKKRILLLAESITSEEGEIGFTNGLLSTFRNSSLFAYILSLPTAAMLFYSFVRS